MILYTKQARTPPNIECPFFCVRTVFGLRSSLVSRARCRKNCKPLYLTQVTFTTAALNLQINRFNVRTGKGTSIRYQLITRGKHRLLRYFQDVAEQLH